MVAVVEHRLSQSSLLVMVVVEAQGGVEAGRQDHGAPGPPDAAGARIPGWNAAMAVACLLRFLRGEDADVAGAHLAARRAR